MFAVSIVYKPEQTPQIERQANRIEDPVMRLRFLRGAMSHEDAPARPRWFRPVVWIAVGVLVMFAPGARRKISANTVAAAARTTASAAARPDLPRVWLVERTGTSELYSNGLRIDTSFRVSNRPRAQYPIFNPYGGSAPVRTGSSPVGIVFHTTESLIAPFEEDQNRRLRELAHAVLNVVRTERAYHYLIDRFGRVYAAVAESDAANHAGYSVWGDAKGVYVNLNDSFLGVSFEAQSGETAAVTPAQIASAKSLTEMLRSRYAIDARNCVTHAQVSVNPDNMRIAEHTDWARGDFPFEAVGLPDNYALPVASLYAFGFEYDAVFLRVAGARWRGLDAAETQLGERAARENVELDQYRKSLHRRYKEIVAALKARQQQESGAEEVAQ